MPPLSSPPMSSDDETFLGDARTAHLSTADAAGKPHVIPICFAYDGRFIYSVLDRKPKTTAYARLRRVRNILANPQVALVADHYEEDWDRLRYVLVTGRAELIESGQERDDAVALLREKYPQYRDMALDDSPVIKVTPERFVGWSSRPQG